VIPEIVASLGFGWVMSHLLGNNRLLAVLAGGVLLAVAAALMQRVEDHRTVATEGADVAAVA
jgi:maltose/moltooligosaccharide transporter